MVVQELERREGLILRGCGDLLFDNSAERNRCTSSSPSSRGCRRSWNRMYRRIQLTYASSVLRLNRRSRSSRRTTSISRKRRGRRRRRGAAEESADVRARNVAAAAAKVTDQSDSGRIIETRAPDASTPPLQLLELTPTTEIAAPSFSTCLHEHERRPLTIPHWARRAAAAPRRSHTPARPPTTEKSSRPPRRSLTHRHQPSHRHRPTIATDRALAIDRPAAPELAHRLHRMTINSCQQHGNP